MFNARTTIAVRNVVQQLCRTQQAQRNAHNLVVEECLLPFESIPGPRRWPALGPINEMLTLGSPNKLHETVDLMHQQYGPIFRIKIGAVNSIFVSCPTYMRAIFLYEGQFPKHPLPESWTYFNQKHNCKRGLFFMDDEEWLHYRKMLNPFFLRDFSPLESSIAEASDEMVESIKDSMAVQTNNPPNGLADKKVRDGESFIEIDDLEARLYRWSIDVTMHVLLGDLYTRGSGQTALKEDLDAFAAIVHRVFETSAALNTVPTWLADKLNMNVWLDFEQTVQDTLALANRIVGTSLKNYSNGNGLLAKFIESNMSKDIICRIFTDLIIAAGDTTAFATEWALYLLSKNPSTQTMVRKHILGHPDNLESSLIKATVKETLRLYPIAPFIGRFMAQDGVLGPYRIPQNTLALLSLYTAGRDEANFSYADKFLPQRWLRNDTSQLEEALMLKPHASMPFVIGSRSCIGKKIAQFQIHSLLTKILQNFSLKLLNEQDVEMRTRMVSVPSEPIRIGIKKL